MPRLITLLTDFGCADTYVAQMKGVIYSLAPEVTIVDITHAIEPQDIIAGARALLEAAPLFPRGTIHIAVVDPGVGTDRAIVCVEAAEQIFVLPDNGLLSPLVEQYPATAIYVVENRNLYRSEVSSTFHGRDIMAPVAAHLAGGLPISEVGTRITELRSLERAQPMWDGLRCTGEIVAIDRFGNLITNIPATLASPLFGGDRIHIQSGIIQISARLVGTYGDGLRGETVVLVGSQRFLEIAVVEGHAAGQIGLTRGAQLSLQSNQDVGKVRE